MTQALVTDAFETHFNEDELGVLSGVDVAKAVILEAQAEQGLVRSVWSICEANGLFEADILRVLCANLINQHKRATIALENQHEQIAQLHDNANALQTAVNNLRAHPARVASQPVRKVYETWRSADDRLHCRCDDGTVWRLETGEGIGRWLYEPANGAPLPQVLV